MFNLDAITNENNKDRNEKWRHGMLTTGPSGSGKTNALLNLIQKVLLTRFICMLKT